MLKQLEVLENDPGTSMTRISVLTWQTTTAVQGTLLENRLYPYHYQPVQELLPTDFLQIRIRLLAWWSNNPDIAFQEHFFVTKLLHLQQEIKSRILSQQITCVGH